MLGEEDVVVLVKESLVVVGFSARGAVETFTVNFVLHEKVR